MSIVVFVYLQRKGEKKNGGNFTDLKFGEPVHQSTWLRNL